MIVTAWLATTVMLNNLGTDLAASVSGFTDWSQVGWAFAGSTAYVLWEIVKPNPEHRNGWHRLILVIIGMVVSLAANTYAADKLGLPIQLCTSALGALGYKVFTFGQKKADTPEESLKDLTGLNNKEKP